MWTVFVEKYGGAFIHGQYPKNADEKYKGELLNALQQMISDAVAITQEGSEINIISAGDKGGSTNVHAEYIKLANAEISKAVLGETLTTEIGDKGSYAAAKAHNLVREDMATADRRRISAAFNRLSSVYTFYNFGAEVAAPKFEFVRDEDLQQDRAKRDKEIYGIGWRPRKSYITREYGIPEEDYDLDFKVVQSQGGDTTKSFAENHTTPCRCHEHDRGITKRIAALFGSKAEKAALKDERLMQEFAEQTLEAGQDELDGTIESYIDALGTVTTYEEGKQAIQKAYQRRVFSPLAHLIDVVRYAAAGIGNHQKRRVKHG